MKTAYSYVRLSSKRQVKGTGEQRQLARPIEICKANGWTLSTKTFSDLGVSAFKGKNRLQGDLATFIQLAKDKKLGESPVLILEQFDRFSRQDIDTSEPALVDLLNSGCDIHIAFNNKTFTKESTIALGDRIEILVSLKAAFEYSANLSKRIKASNVSLKEKINNGDIMKHRNTPNYYSFDKTKKQYVQNDKSEIVKQIIEEFIDGKTMYSICTGLNDKGIATIGYNPSSKWQTMSLKNILSNDALYGKLYNNFSFYSDPIIDKATFDKIQLILSKSKNNKGRHSSTFINIFRGLAKCPICKESFSCYSDLINRRTKKQHKTPYRYLRCSGVSNGTKCKNKHNVNLRDIEDEFFSVFLQKDPANMFVSKAKGNISELNKVDLQLSGVTKSINKLISLDMDMDMDELKDQLTELKRQKNLLLTKKQELSMNDIQTISNNESIINFKKLLAEISSDAGATGFNNAILSLREKLNDNELRLKIRTMLPSIVGKIEFNSINKEWKVFDTTGKHIYTSIING